MGDHIIEGAKEMHMCRYSHADGRVENFFFSCSLVICLELRLGIAQACMRRHREEYRSSFTEAKGVQCSSHRVLLPCTWIAGDLGSSTLQSRASDARRVLPRVSLSDASLAEALPFTRVVFIIVE
jgi:hypothetical protein